MSYKKLIKQRLIRAVIVALIVIVIGLLLVVSIGRYFRTDSAAAEQSYSAAEVSAHNAEADIMPISTTSNIVWYSCYSGNENVDFSPNSSRSYTPSEYQDILSYISVPTGAFNRYNLNGTVYLYNSWDAWWTSSSGSSMKVGNLTNTSWSNFLSYSSFEEYNYILSHLYFVQYSRVLGSSSTDYTTQFSFTLVGDRTLSNPIVDQDDDIVLYFYYDDDYYKFGGTYDERYQYGYNYGYQQGRDSMDFMNFVGTPFEFGYRFDCMFIYSSFCDDYLLRAPTGDYYNFAVYSWDNNINERFFSAHEQLGYNNFVFPSDIESRFDVDFRHLNQKLLLQSPLTCDFKSSSLSISMSDLINEEVTMGSLGSIYSISADSYFADYLFTARCFSVDSKGNYSFVSKTSSMPISSLRNFTFNKRLYSDNLHIFLELTYTGNAYNNGYVDGKLSTASTSYQEGYNDGYERGEADGYSSGYTNGANKGYSDQIVSSPLSLFLQPVSDFMNIKLFGTISLSTAFNIVLFVALAAIFIKMFAGG